MIRNRLKRINSILIPYQFRIQIFYRDGEPSDDESVDREDQENHADIQLELECLRELEEVQVLIDKLNFEEPFMAKEFVLYDESEITTGMILDEEILKLTIKKKKKSKRNLYQ